MLAKEVFRILKISRPTLTKCEKRNHREVIQDGEDEDALEEKKRSRSRKR